MRKALLLFLLILSLPLPSRAMDLSPSNCLRESLPHCNITTLATNQYAEGRPVIIFFPGYDEATSNRNLIQFLRNYHLYDALDADLVAVTLRGTTPWHRNWEPAALDLFDYLKDRYAASPFPILVDTVSMGGYGGCWLTDYFQQNGLPVAELTLADACGSWCISVDWLRNLAAAGTRINILGCTGSLNISQDTRAVIDELQGTENIRTLILESSHGAVLSKAILDHGLHSEYAVPPPAED